MKHLSQLEAIDYLSGRLSEEKETDTEEHIAGCDRCAERVRALRILGTYFDEIWDELNPPIGSEAYWVERMQGALEYAEKRTESSELRERIRGWLHELHAKTEAALEIVLDTAKRSADIICKGAEQLIGADAGLQFEPVRVRVARRGAKVPPVISVRAEGPPWVNVTVDSLAGKVIIESDLLDQPWPLVLLVPEDDSAESIVGDFRQKDNHLVSEITGVRSGKYKLFLQKLT
jgi:hypothetical protein